MSFEYEEQNTTYYQQELERQQNNTDRASDVPVLFLKEGITQVRILPAAVGSGGLWMRSYKEHYVANAEPVKFFTCLSTYNEECPICEHAGRLLEEGKETSNEELIEQAKQFRARAQFLANVFVYSSPDSEQSGLDKGIFVMKFGTVVKRALLEYNQDVDGWADITNLVDGVDLKITRTGKGLSTQYTTIPLARRSNLMDQLAAVGLDLNNFTMYNLDDVYPVRPYADLEQAINFKPKPPTVQAQAVPVPQATPTQVPVPQPAAPQPVQAPTMPPPPPSVTGVVAPPAQKEGE